MNDGLKGLDLYKKQVNLSPQKITLSILMCRNNVITQFHNHKKE